jgi:hypothetical protein
MYASDMIYMIFKNIQEEYEQNRAVMADARRNGARADSMPARDRRPEPAEGRPASGRTGEENPSSGSRKWVWAGVGVAALAAGVGAYLIFSGDPQVTVKEKEVRF